jgi:hypothetical protein
MGSGLADGVPEQADVVDLDLDDVASDSSRGRSKNRPTPPGVRSITSPGFSGVKVEQ